MSTAGSLITQDYQLELRGLLLGAGTPYEHAKPIEGLGVPPVREVDLERPEGHGEFPGAQYLAARTIRMGVNIAGDTSAETLANAEALGAAWKPVDESLDGGLTLPLILRLPNRAAMRLLGKPTRYALDLTELKSGHATADLEFKAVDPRLYSNTLSQAVTGPGSTSGGLGFPHGFAHGFGAASSGIVTATNGGNFPTFPTARLAGGTGGLINPTIYNTTTGEELALTITVGAGQYLDIDFDAQEVLLNGTASRANTVERPASQFFALVPGANAIRFVASGAGTLTLYWRDAYIT